ncbi:DNA-directed DNA polymerase [Tanacetum coccineum]
MKELVDKFIEEGRQEYDEVRTFIRKFKTSNELLMKEQNSLLSELKIEVHELSRTIRMVLAPKNDVKGITTRGGRTTFVEDPNEANKEVSLLTNKSRLEEACTITMNERCSATLLNRIPSKEKDPGSFTIPCRVGDLHIKNALADLGANISLMPYAMYEKLGLREPKPTRMSLELLDRSIQYLIGIAEDVMIKIDKFDLPIDFVILDLLEDSRIPIILGRLFLATTRVVIDVFDKKITLKVGDEQVIFDIESSMKRPNSEDDSYYNIDELDNVMANEKCELLENSHEDSFPTIGLEHMVNDVHSQHPASENSIRHIDDLDTAYRNRQHDEFKREQLYTASANEINEKKPELKNLPSHLEYAYLNNDESSPVIISSQLSALEKKSPLHVLENRKGAIA